jgi:hypothetical protein
MAPLDRRRAFELGVNEDKNTSLTFILRREHEQWADVSRCAETLKTKAREKLS